jgi:hypothetical protein
MTDGQTQARSVYNVTMAEARERFDQQLHDAEQVYDAAVMAAAATYSAAERNARATYWSTRHEGWQQASLVIPILTGEHGGDSYEFPDQAGP